MTAKDYLSSHEIRSFLTPSDWHGWTAVLFDWLVIGGVFAAVALWPHALVILLAAIVMGGRQLALAILVHEAAHRSLFKTRGLNDWVGKWLCGAPVWQDLPRYREHHMKHHKLAGTGEDPDISLVKSFPVTRKSLMRKICRDLVGITGVKRIYGLILMDLGFLSYTIAADPKPLPQAGRSRGDILRMCFENMHPVVLANGLLFGALALAGHPMLYLLWVGSYLTTFSLFLRVRSIAEHACTRADIDPFKNTRTTTANFFARMTLAPHRVNFHLEHHLLMTVPYFRLPALHKELKERKAFAHAFLASGYVEVLKTATK